MRGCSRRMRCTRRCQGPARSVGCCWGMMCRLCPAQQIRLLCRQAPEHLCNCRNHPVSSLINCLFTPCTCAKMAFICQSTWPVTALHAQTSGAMLQDDIWEVVQAQLQQGGSEEPLAGAAQLARLLTAPGLRCASSLSAALQETSLQVWLWAPGANTQRWVNLQPHCEFNGQSLCSDICLRLVGLMKATFNSCLL